MCKEKVCVDDEQKIIAFMEGKTGNDLIEVLHKVQRTYGYIPKDTVTLIAKTLKLPISRIYGVITFYSHFSMEPRGKYAVSVCLGTSCYVKNAEKILEEFSTYLDIGVGETTDDRLFSLIETRCIGECAQAPVVSVNDQVYNKVTVEDVKNIVAELREGTHEG